VTHLLDSNAGVTLPVLDHVRPGAAALWWSATEEPFATCPITQGALLRLRMREGPDASGAKRVLGLLTGHGRDPLWPDDIGQDSIDLSRALGHAQVTDSCLADLARRRQAKLATLD